MLLFIIIITFIFITVYSLSIFTTKEIGNSTATVTTISSSSGWSGSKVLLVEVFCKDHNISQTTSIPRNTNEHLRIGDSLNVTVYSKLFVKKSISIDFNN